MVPEIVAAGPSIERDYPASKNADDGATVTVTQSSVYIAEDVGAGRP